MIEVKNIDDVLLKIENLKASIKLSDEILPLFSDMFKFIKDIIPLMLEANLLVNDSNKTIPTASENLSNVTKTTELATNEVLDRIDLIMGKLSELKTSVEADGGKDNHLKLIDEINSNTMDIEYAFQFQDITAQQLDHVNRILEAIHGKFINIFKASNSIKGNTDLGSDIIKAIENQLEGGAQSEPQQQFEEKVADTVRQNGISQDKIDKLFK